MFYFASWLWPKPSPKESSPSKSFKILLHPYTHEASLTLRTQQSLDKLLRVLYLFPDITLQIEAHHGGFDFQNRHLLSRSESQILSQQQAEAIRNYLTGKGIKASQISLLALGNEVPHRFSPTQGGKNFVLGGSPYAHIKNTRIVLSLIPRLEDDFLNLALELEAQAIEYQP
ncbi:MAG: OmpA family protein [Microscillaceae bacterium]|nr:OmpA family protein [Microscillaceae bacterium]